MSKRQANEYSVWMRDELYPPVSPRDVLRSARELLVELELTDENMYWELLSIQLEPTQFTLEREDGIQLWHYVVNFRKVSRPETKTNIGIRSGFFNTFRIVVLMNGETIRPLVYERTSNTARTLRSPE
jgi:hypothetical protein